METKYIVQGATCMQCKKTIESNLRQLHGVTDVSLIWDSKILIIESEEMISIDLIQDKIGKQYKVLPYTKLPDDHHNLNTSTKPQQPSFLPIHTFRVEGMSCQGCLSHVESILAQAPFVQWSKVDLDKKQAQIIFHKGGTLQQLKQVFKDDGGAYAIYGLDEKAPVRKKEVSLSSEYYCPMRCEGDKIYSHPGFCPICGMDLVPKVQKDSSINPESITLQKKLWIALACTIPIFFLSMGEMLWGNGLQNIVSSTVNHVLQFLFSLPVVFYCGWFCFQRGVMSIRTSHYNMFTLISIGAGSAWIFSVFALFFPQLFPDEFRTHNNTIHLYFEATAVILTLVLLGQLMESKAHYKTQDAIRSLLAFMPSTAYRLTSSGGEEEIAEDEIEVGDRLRVYSSSKIPADGIILEGESSIDESMITGEPIPADKQVGDKVCAGTTNGDGVFIMQVEKTGNETLLAQIVEMVSRAATTQAPVQKLVDKIASYFVPIVVLTSLLTFVLWYLLASKDAFSYGFINAVAVLIIACPCALGLATPMSVMVGVGKGAKHGILIKSAEALQKMARVDTLLTDKTGTLTQGMPTVEKIHITASFDKENALRILYTLSSLSKHPLSQAITQKLQHQNLQKIAISLFQNVPGQGVEATLKENAHSVLLGNILMIDEKGVKLNEEIASAVKKEQQDGKTISYFAQDGHVLGYIVFFDSPKEHAKEVINKLEKEGIETQILTGDNPEATAYVANKVGITNYKAQLLPNQKLLEVEKLQHQGHTVAMVGDGINDAPALMQSDVGIAMGNGADIAIDSAQIILLHGDIDKLYKAYTLSKKTMENIKSNLLFALIYNILGIPLAAGILYPICGIHLSPMVAAVAMSLSSISVIFNALRLQRVKL